jgi:hypothetical protein
VLLSTLYADTKWKGSALVTCIDFYNDIIIGKKFYDNTADIDSHNLNIMDCQ